MLRIAQLVVDVTGTGTIEIFSYRTVAVWTGPVVPCMATRAGGLVLRIAPDRGFLVAEMAGAAGGISTMITGVIRRAMNEDLRREERGVVTVVAFEHGHEMAWELADGRDAVVTAHAAVGDAGVIEYCGAECECRVADPAVAVRRNMIRCLADREDAVVTASAIVRDAGVIERRG